MQRRSCANQAEKNNNSDSSHEKGRSLLAENRRSVQLQDRHALHFRRQTTWQPDLFNPTRLSGSSELQRTAKGNATLELPSA
jgi:hypothetical protein